MDEYELSSLIDQFKFNLLHGNDTGQLRLRLIDLLGGNSWMVSGMDNGTFALYLQLLLMTRRPA